MRTRESFLGLIAELEGAHLEFGCAMTQNRRAWQRIQDGADDPLDWGALGFTLHSAYGVLENYFLRVSKFFENALTAEKWHKSLVEKMALEIPGVRPALFTEEPAKRLALELLRFRHLFRNVYGEDLDPEKTSAVQQAAAELAELFSKSHTAFVEKLRAIAGELL